MYKTISQARENGFMEFVVAELLKAHVAILRMLFTNIWSSSKSILTNS